MNTAFFDLDGTLTDPKPGITGCIQYALDRLGFVAPPADDLIWCIGPPLHASMKKFVGTDELATRAVELYRERFGDVGLFENEVYDGIEQTLSDVAATGRRLFVATSKPKVYADRIIAHFGLSRHFERVFGSELDGTRTDKAELLAYALAETHTDPRRAIMIGDRSHDMIGARKNGMKAIGVLYGYGSLTELTDAGAHHLCAAHPEVVAHCAAAIGTA
ncbi:MAG TPA: HAD family hydrolase [Bradyrhizobium sp.]|uniref:HAD family hydrolase n=1 Tax=Bradyrhizobium sp. TaxID=376 RepID=UPI002D7E4E89|nr:HAD family hydrolase [Bradyrhizobium sp.]HET7884732.1 HAD family hydrolase [Bradyrhizobium sp.]